MKLIFLYGPPAVGKLTIAKELHRKTKYLLFHNHLVNDALSSVMEFATDEFWKEGDKMKLRLIEIAAKNKEKGLIFTMAPSSDLKEDLPVIKRLRALLKKYNSKLYCVKLTASHQALMKRVKHPSRKNYKKVKSRAWLRNHLKKGKHEHIIKGDKHIFIDNTNKSAKRVAQEIISAFKLK